MAFSTNKKANDAPIEAPPTPPATLSVSGAVRDYNKLTVKKLRELLNERSLSSTGLTRKQQLIKKLEEHDLYVSQPSIDYNAFTVKDLRQIIKDRNFPSTGLTRKAQLVAKLAEHDASLVLPPWARKNSAPKQASAVESRKAKTYWQKAQLEGRREQEREKREWEKVVAKQLKKEIAQHARNASMTDGTSVSEASSVPDSHDSGDEAIKHLTEDDKTHLIEDDITQLTEDAMTYLTEDVTDDALTNPTSIYDASTPCPPDPHAFHFDGEDGLQATRLVKIPLDVVVGKWLDKHFSSQKEYVDLLFTPRGVVAPVTLDTCTHDFCIPPPSPLELDSRHENIRDVLHSTRRGNLLRQVHSTRRNSLLRQVYKQLHGTFRSHSNQRLTGRAAVHQMMAKWGHKVGGGKGLGKFETSMANIIEASDQFRRIGLGYNRGNGWRIQKDQHWRMYRPAAMGLKDSITFARPLKQKTVFVANCRDCGVHKLVVAA